MAVYHILHAIAVICVYCGIGMLIATVLERYFHWTDDDYESYIMVMLTYPCWIILYIIAFIWLGIERLIRWIR